MSAERGYTLTRADLIQHGRKIEACDVFTVNAGGSHHRCDACDATYHEHIIAAQRAAAIDAWLITQGVPR